MKPETQAALDKFNSKYFPGTKERPYIEHPSADPLHAASKANVAKQCDELRELVRQAVPFVLSAYAAAEVEPDSSAMRDWLRRARSASK